MSIKVKISMCLQRFTNHTEVVEVNGSTVGECLKHLVKLFDKDGKLPAYFGIYVNGESAYPEELGSRLKTETSFL